MGNQLIVTYIRSSSYNAESICQNSYFLSYVLGIRSLSGKAADMGNVVHKAMELFARQKQCWQAGTEGYEDENFGYLKAADINDEMAVDISYKYYSEMSPHLTWTKADLKTCHGWTAKAVQLNDGMYDPRKQDVVEAEQKFDFVIDKPWAAYEYELGGEIIKGQLGIKGTMDLVVRDGPNDIHVIDYKTGQRKDWAKDGNDKKTYKELRYDPQLCIYHYATCMLFPEAEDITMTIYYINDGGPFTFFFEKKDMEFTESILQKKFDRIRNTKVPNLRVSYRCTKFCYFGKNMSEQDPTKTICQFHKEQVDKIGVEQTMLQFGSTGAYKSYGSGGGRQ